MIGADSIISPLKVNEVLSRDAVMPEMIGIPIAMTDTENI